MMEDELVKIWQSSPSMEQIKFEKSRLILDVQSGINRVDKLIKYRDAIESGTALFIVVPAFAYAAYQMPNVVTKIACVFIILWSFCLVYIFRRARRHKPGTVTANYIEYLNKTKDHLQVQKKLLDTVLWWYILPAQAGVTLFSLGVALDTGSYEHFVKVQILGLGLAIVTVYLNKRTLKKTLNPRLEKIDDLLHLMKTE